MKISPLCISRCWLAGLAIYAAIPGAASAAEQITGFANLPAILSAIKAPQFPEHDFPITEYGAVADSDCSDAIRKAIDACSKAGGGRVTVPDGKFKTAAIHLQSNVNLHLAAGATLEFLSDPNKYLPLVLTRFEGVECMNYSPFIYALEQENIAISGEGTLDGGASNETWWDWCRKGGSNKQTPGRDKLNVMGEAGLPVEQRTFGEGSFLRPNFIQPYRCNNVLIEGVHIVNSPMWEINPVLCKNVTVRNVNIKSHGPNNDGCDPESCKGVLIEGCTFDTGDDCIAIKSGRNNDGRRVGVAAENTIIRNCNMKDGHGGVTIGSEISGGCKNVFVENCKMDSVNLERGIRFKSNAQRGGVIENVFVRNVQIGQVAKAVLAMELDYEEGAKGPHKPVIRNVSLDHVTSESSKQVMYIAGFQGAVIENIRLANCTFRGVKGEDTIRDAPAPTRENVVVEMAKGKK
ncbi:MAG: hypothetical protein QOD99_1806 [Chthoniobacter sp.]|jgi:unsaturated rhamnogalacturonyl hydrolase|nr:hypothetical protein [Chthoniobacter sp.]